MNAPLLPALFEHPEADAQVVLGVTRVAYRLRRSQRRSIGLLISEQGLTVSAPLRARQMDIEQALQSKASWILRKLVQQRERSRQQAASTISWGEGALVPCLGGSLRLGLRPALRRHQGPDLAAWAAGTGSPFTPPGLSSLMQPAALPVADLLLALPADSPPERIRDATARWLQAQALALFQQRCGLYAARLGVQPQRLGLSSARTRWGSATVDGTIRLNWHLVHHPLRVIDYVVAHELAHLREMNHSPAFWALVRAVIPDVDACKAALRHRLPPHWE